MKKKTCTKCINDNTVIGIKFDEDGVCNFCREYEKLAPKINDEKAMNSLWMERIEAVRGKYAYDAAVGISGGKDSMYVLYKLVKEYKLKVKAFTMDNGFLADSAKERIDILVKELGVEHEYITFDSEEIKKVYKMSIKKTFAPCSGCSYIGYTQMIRFAAENNIPLIIHGRSTPQMFRALKENSKDPFMPILMSGLKSLKDINIKDMYDDTLDKTDKILGYELSSYLRESIDIMKKSDVSCEFLAYFLYHPYSEEKVFDFLEENSSWRRPTTGRTNHFDCLVHDACAYLYQLVETRPHIMPELSVMVREQTISREKALEILKECELKEEPAAEMDRLFNFLNLNKKKFIRKHKMIGRIRKITGV